MLEPSKGVRQLVFCLTILFAYCLHQYNELLQSGKYIFDLQILYLLFRAHEFDFLNFLSLDSDGKISSVLVEAFVTKDIDETNVLPIKKLKIDSSDPSLPVLTAGEGNGDIIKHFNFALTCWSFLQSTEAYQKGMTNAYKLCCVFHINCYSGLFELLVRILEIETAYST